MLNNSGGFEPATIYLCIWRVWARARVTVAVVATVFIQQLLFDALELMIDYEFNTSKALQTQDRIEAFAYF